MFWKVLVNKKPIGCIESNHAWASAYWASRCTAEKRFTLQAITIGKYGEHHVV